MVQIIIQLHCNVACIKKMMVSYSFVWLVYILLIKHTYQQNLDIFSNKLDQVFKYTSKDNHNPTTYFPHSLKSWTILDGRPNAKKNTFSVVSMVVDHHSEGSWYVPSLHDKYSIGWNRTVGRGFLTRPYACNIRFLGVGFEQSTLNGFTDGGGGYITIEYKEGKKAYYHGFHKNETFKVYCYYMSGKNYGSEFLVMSSSKFINFIYCT